MDNNKFQIEVLERLTAIETTLKQMDYKSIEDKADRLNEKVIELENKVKNNDGRLNKIEDNNRWLWRSVAVSILGVVVGAIVAVIKMS